MICRAPATSTCGSTASISVRLEQEKLCLLVMIGVRADGRKGAGRAHRRVPVGRVVG